MPSGSLPTRPRQHRSTMRALLLLAAAAPATGQRAALLATGIRAAPIVYFRGREEVAPAPEGSPQLAAPGNWFSVNDEQKLLPEVMSKLTFETSDHAAPGDLEAEEALRTSAHWGRLYVEGWPASMQYLRGHFGEVAPRGALPVLAADPPDLCSSLSDALVTLIREKPSIIVAMRGTCTFGTKATFLAEAAGHNASLATLLLVNNEPGNQHAPGPDAHEVQASIAMVAEWEGTALLEELNRTQLTASFVPVNCVESSETRQTSALCEPCAQADALYVENERIDGGTLQVKGETFEYLLAEFGRPFRGIARRVVDIGDGCKSVTEDLTGALAVVQRGGGCQFIHKAWNAQAAGAAEVLISNEHAGDALVRAGCHPRWAARNVTLAIGLVSSTAGAALRSSSRATARPLHGGHGAAWSELAKYAAGETRPRSKKAREKRVDALAAERRGGEYAERRAFLVGGATDEL